jgi:hypothetical protein
MGGGSTTVDTTSQQQSINEIPQWVQNAGQANYGLAQQVASQPLQQYQGQMVAGVSPQMQQSWDLAANSGNVGQGAQAGAQAALLSGANYSPEQIKAQQVSAGQLSDTNLFPYMNPYTQDVIDKTLPIMQQGLALQQNQQQNQANAANAFGGSRQAIQQGVTQAQGALNEGQMAAQLNQANFAQARAAAEQDIQGRMQASLANQGANLTASQANQNAGLTANQQKILAGSGLGTLGTQQMQNNVANFGMLTTAGSLQEQQQQNQINAQIAKFQQAWQYPQQQLGMMESALGMTPYNTGTSGSSASTQTTTNSNPMQAALGGLQTLGGLFGSAGLFGTSDRRLKTDIKRIDTHPSGLPIYAYRYKGDPKTYPKVAGPMAEDVAKIAPHAVRPMGVKGRLAIDMDALNRHYAGGTSNVEPVDPKRMKMLESLLKYRDVGSDAYFKPGSNQSTANPARPGDAYGVTPEESLALERAVGPNLLSRPEDYRPPGYSRGATRVPGFGRRDTVPAMLTPGEAVLTRHGASLLGRRNISALNTPPSSPGVARAIGMLGPSSTPGRLSPNATPPTRAVGMLGVSRETGQRRRPRVMGMLGG